jgi:indole-3-glycerol phosphate synthase
LPELYPRVAESGVSSRDDVERIVEIGYNVALIGTTLMHSDEPARLLSELLTVGREHAMALKSKGEA